MFQHLNRPLQQHHMFVMIMVVVGLVFGSNIFALSRIQSSVSYVNNDPVSPVILARFDNSEDSNGEAAQKNNLEPLSKKLISELAKHETNIAVAIKDLKTDSYLGINDETTMKAASFYKLFVGYEVASRIDNQKLTWSQPTGYEAGGLSVSHCFSVMINVSDNDCGRALRKLIGGNDEPLASLAEAGFIGTNIMHDYPTTSASDVALLFEDLYHKQSLKRTTNTKFIDALREQQISNRLPQGLGEEASMAHKTADLEGYSHDGGIVYAPHGDYIIVIMSGPWAHEYTDAPPVFAKLSRLVYDWFSSNNS